MELERLLDLAAHRLQHGQLDSAIESLREVLAEDPDHALAHAYLAICLLQKKRLHAAQHEAKLALLHEPDAEIAHYAMANICMAQRKFTTAQEHIDRLHDLDPTDPRHYLLQAELNHFLRKRAQILPLLERALELAPESSRVHAELSDYYRETGQLQKAEQYAVEALRLEPENVNALISMGHLLLRQGNTTLAREHAISALYHAPDNSAALALLAAIKAHSSPLLGLWWRYNAWLSSVGATRSIVILLFAYLTVTITRMALGDLGHRDAAGTLQLLWLGIVIYTFIGPTLFMRSLNKELREVKLSREF